MARLTISLFGPFQVTLGGKPVTAFESARVRALLAFLAAQAHSAHSREALAELLWPNHPPGAALANLRHTLANLRKAIADPGTQPPFLLITPTTLQFNRDAEVSIDVMDFMSFWAHGAPTTADACRNALTLRRGPFLEGFSLNGSPQFEEWLVVMAERLDYLAVQAITYLIDDAVARGDFVHATDWTFRQLEMQPWNEEAHQQLIWQLACSGQCAAALHHYDVCRRLLAAELGVEPQPAMQAVVERIRRSNPAVDPGGAVEPSPAGNQIHLPASPSLFLGRVAELKRIAACFANPECRLLTILGPGGIGKTLLAIEAARAHSAHFSDGVYFVNLAAVTQPALIGDAILRALTLSPSTPQAAAERLGAYLHERQLLLLLDNFEHLLDGADLLPLLLKAAPRLKLLVTSRSRLLLQEEWLLPLDGLATPSVDAMDFSLADFASLRLFVKRAERLVPGFQPTEAELIQIAEICCLLEGMPLAIELAAGWTRTLPLANITEAVRSGLDLFTTSLRDLPPRHRSMHAVFDHSWRLLSARQRSLLRQLAVFRGGFTAGAAAAVAEASPTELQALVDHSWLRAHAGRFTLHQLMRHYCAEKLQCEHLAETSESTEVVNRRYMAYFAGITAAEERTLNYI